MMHVHFNCKTRSISWQLATLAIFTAILPSASCGGTQQPRHDREFLDLDFVLDRNVPEPPLYQAGICVEGYVDCRGGEADASGSNTQHPIDPRRPIYGGRLTIPVPPQCRGRALYISLNVLASAQHGCFGGFGVCDSQLAPNDRTSVCRIRCQLRNSDSLTRPPLQQMPAWTSGCAALGGDE